MKPKITLIVITFLLLTTVLLGGFSLNESNDSSLADVNVAEWDFTANGQKVNCEFAMKPQTDGSNQEIDGIVKDAIQRGDKGYFVIKLKNNSVAIASYEILFSELVTKLNGFDFYYGGELDSNKTYAENIEELNKKEFSRESKINADSTIKGILDRVDPVRKDNTISIKIDWYCKQINVGDTIKDEDGYIVARRQSGTISIVGYEVEGNTKPAPPIFKQLDK